jgi:DNA (cytosine-5)-methyltransferase 1
VRRGLDVYCGAGGATRGYQLAGFCMVGVDIEPQPHYCGEKFIQADALDALADRDFVTGFDFIHASPPCQYFTAMSNRWRGHGGRADGHVDLLTPTRALLRSIGLPYIIENVPAAKRAMAATLILHGGMFGLGVNRPRLFESNILMLAPPEPAPRDTVGVYGKAPDGRLLWARADGTEQHAPASLAEAQEAMGMDWGDWQGVKEAIPPAYSEFIGHQLLEHLERAA